MKKSQYRGFGRSFGQSLCLNLATDLSVNQGIRNYFSGSPILSDTSHQTLTSIIAESETREDFMLSYLRKEVFSKFPFEIPGVDRRQAALVKFVQSEEACAATNERFEDWRLRCSIPQGVVRSARRHIRNLLGRFDINRLYGRCNFGPGASTSLRRIQSSKQNKWVRSTHITEAALPYYRAFFQFSGMNDLPHRVELVAGNKVTTVPKSSLIDRTIAIEPDWNMFFQKGMGALIRQKLQKVGLLTPEAQDQNKILACYGSRTGRYATIDLSAASDTISLFVVMALIPEDWLEHLLALRSPFGSLDGKLITYEKISSMGNGFTFELETLIFWGLCKAVCTEGTTLVYGDDIIIPTQYYHEVVAVLESFGFRTNESKSFHSGPFRESCGGHYWYGCDVSPFYIRKLPQTAATGIAVGNNILDWSLRWNGGLDLLRESWLTVLRATPRAGRGPFGVQGCLWSNWDQATPKWNRDTQSYEIKTVSLRNRYTDLSSYGGAYLYKLWEGSPDLEASRLTTASAVECFGTTFVDRESWIQLPA